MYRLLTTKPLLWWQGTLVALVTTGCAWLLRASLAPVFGEQALYATFMGAAVITAVIAGWKYAALSAVLGAVLANAFVKEGSVGMVVATVIYVAVTGYMIYLIHGLTSSLRREIGLRETLDAVSREYRHRIRNLLAVSEAVVQQTSRNASSVDEFKDKVLARLQALSRAQDLLLDQGDTAVPLRAVLSQSLSPFDIEARLIGSLAGPEVMLASDTAVATALLVNELATNSTKYGALSSPEGRLHLGWSVHSDWAEVEWKEISGPPVATPARRGFGSRLVERALPHGSSAHLLFEPDGVRCTIKLKTSPG
jgi:two-component sensor histidine kinase